MVGLQATVFKTKLGPALNGIINYEIWVPARQLMFPQTKAFLRSIRRAPRRRRRSARLLPGRFG